MLCTDSGEPNLETTFDVGGKVDLHASGEGALGSGVYIEEDGGCSRRGMMLVAMAKGVVAFTKSSPWTRLGMGLHRKKYEEGS